MLDYEKVCGINAMLKILNFLINDIETIDNEYTERFQSTRTRQNLESAIEHLKSATKNLVDSTI